MKNPNQSIVVYEAYSHRVLFRFARGVQNFRWIVQLEILHILLAYNTLHFNFVDTV